MNETGRLIGRMQIANDMIRVEEITLGDGDEQLNDWLKKLGQSWLTSATYQLQWCAFASEDKLVAYGALEKDEDQRTGHLFIAVADEYRRCGLGKFMCHMGVDVAIRHRLKRMVALVLPHEVELAASTAAMKILDDCEFEEIKGSNPIRFERMLKWQPSPLLPDGQ